jgi:hypothetical protein
MRHTSLTLCPAFLASLLLSKPAFAHEGHGLWGAHFHTEELWGFAILAIAVVAAVAVAFKNRK